MATYIQALNGFRECMRILWVQACLWDGISPNAPFVVFSDENPYSEAYTRTYTNWMALYRPSVEA